MNDINNIEFSGNYNDFNSAEELRNFFKINESKKEEDDKFKYTEEHNKPGYIISKENKYEVRYADLDKELNNIFKHIIIFTNEKNSKKNKTLKNINIAISNLKKNNVKIIPKLHVFDSSKVDYDEDTEKNILTIYDDEESFDIKNESNIDTLVFSRLGVQGEKSCGHIISLLQDRGIIILNPIRYSEIACNKYDSAVLFKNAEIPQPNFCLMTKIILYNEELYLENMRDVYPNFKNDGDKDEDLQFVVKILDGHGGTGVMLLTGKNILPVLQAIFEIDPERELIIQKKEEADIGDIRVHVLTLRNKQIILGAMKRIKIKSDFRSNVSLGAEIESVKLTSEQEQIALKTALISKLPWCAVDIMPLKKGSNEKVGDNVVLEINASPGTDGISEILGVNFINILLNELTEPSEFFLQEKIAGYLETVTLNFGKDNIDMLAKLDTGNGTRASAIEVGDLEQKDKKVKFTLLNNHYEFDIVDISKVYVGERSIERPVIIIPEISLGKRKMINVKVSLVKSREKNTSNILINRELLSCLGYVVSPTKIHILTDEMEKTKII